MDTLVEGQEMTFTKTDGPGKDQSTRVKIDPASERKIGSGRYGDVFEAQVTIGSRTEKFVLKRFKDPAELHAANAMRNYDVAKKAGLKVFHTYRFGEDNTTILMSTGNTDKAVCIGTNYDSPQVEELLGQKIDNVDVEDFDNFVDMVLGQAVIAGDNNIDLHGDAFLYFVDRATRTKLDFVIGDLDNVSEGKTYAHANGLKRNLDGALTSLKHFISQNFKEPENYIKDAEMSYWSSLYHLGLTNA